MQIIPFSTHLVLAVYIVSTLSVLNLRGIQCAKISFEIPNDSTHSLFGRNKCATILKNVHAALKTNGSAVISGPKGVGKTALAIKFIYEATLRGNYSNFIWINAESEQTLKESFVKLVTRYKLVDVDDTQVPLISIPLPRKQQVINEQQKENSQVEEEQEDKKSTPVALTLFKLKEIASQIYGKLSGLEDVHQTLFIFDGVNSNSDSDSEANSKESKNQKRSRKSKNPGKFNIRDFLPSTLIHPPSSLQRSSLKIVLPHALITIRDAKSTGTTLNHLDTLQLNPLTQEEVMEIIQEELLIEPEFHPQAQQSIEALAKSLYSPEDGGTIPLKLKSLLDFFQEKFTRYDSKEAHQQLVLEAINNYIKSLEVSKEDGSGEKLEQASILEKISKLNEKAEKLLLEKQYESALALKLEAHQLFLEHTTIPREPELELVQDLADIYFLLENYTASLAYFEKAYDLRIKVHSDSSSDRIVTNLQSMGLCHFYLGDYEMALTLLKKVFASRKESLGGGHSHTITVLGQIAMVIQSSAQDSSSFEEALEIYKNIAEIQETQVEISLWESESELESDGGDKMAVVHHHAQDYFYILQQMIRLYEELGQYDESLKLWWKLYGIRENILGANHEESLQTLEGVAACLKTLGYSKNAVEILETINERRKGTEQTPEKKSEFITKNKDEL